jgi:hypothetical protein
MRRWFSFPSVFTSSCPGRLVFIVSFIPISITA